MKLLKEIWNERPEILAFIALIVLWLIIASCSYKSCPTYY